MDPSTTTPADHQNLHTLRSPLLGAATVAVSLLAVAAGAWGLSNADASDTRGPGVGRPGQLSPGQSVPGRNQQNPPAPLGQDLASMLFNADGSVNEDLLTEYVNRLPGGLDQFLEFAVQNGELTDEQAAAIASAASGSGQAS